jgi:PKD repeat protein
LPYFEGFEKPWINKDGMVVPSVFWKNTPAQPATWSPGNSGTNGSSHCASYNAQSSVSGTLDLYVDFSSVGGDKVLSFYYYNVLPNPVQHIPSIPSTEGGLVGYLSTDGGLTFNTNLFDLQANKNGWTRVSFNLGTLTSPNAVIRFKGIGGANNPWSNVMIDNVSIYSKFQPVYVYADVPLIEKFVDAWKIYDSINAVPSPSWRSIPDPLSWNAWRLGSGCASFYEFGKNSEASIDLFVDFSKLSGKKFLSFRDTIYIPIGSNYHPPIYGSGLLEVSLSKDDGQTFNRIFTSEDHHFKNPVFIDLNNINSRGIIRFKGSIHSLGEITFRDIKISNIKADFSTDTLAGAAPFTVQFHNQSFGDSVICKWDFNNDGIVDAMGPNPSYTYNSAGVYSVKLIGSKDGIKDSVIKSNLIRVFNQPTPASLPFYESFDSVWKNRGAVRDIPSVSWRNLPWTGNNSWSREDDGVLRGAWSYLGNHVSGINGTHSACFNSSTTKLTGFLDLFLDFSTLNGEKGLSFMYWNFLRSDLTSKDSLKIYLSDDGGITFRKTPLISLGENSGWEKIAINLGNINYTRGVVRFAAKGDALFLSDIMIDNVRVSTFMADFRTDVISGALPLTVHFTNKSIGNITAYKWDFNNDNIIDATTADPVYTFDKIGSYSVKLIIEGSLGSDTIVKNNYVTVTAYASVPFYESFEQEWISRDYIRDVPSLFWKNYRQLNDYFIWLRDDDKQVNESNWQKYSPPGADGTNHSARSYSSRGGNSKFLDLFFNFSSATGKKYLSFWYINTNGPDSLKLYLSVNGGKTFDSPFFYLGVKRVWTKINVDLGDQTSRYGVIRFESTHGHVFENVADTSDIGLDEIRIDNLKAEFSADVMEGTEPLTVHFTDQSSGEPTSWEWDFNNDSIIDATDQNPIFTFNEKDDYTVVLRVSKPYFQDINVKTDYITVSDISSIDNDPVKDFVKVSPVPADDFVKIEFKNLDNVSNFEIFDSNGNLIIPVTSVDKTIYYIDLSGFKNGLYYLRIISGGKLYIKKIIKS